MTAREMFESMGYECEIATRTGGGETYTQITYTLTVEGERYIVDFISGKDCKRFYYGCDRGGPRDTFDLAVSSCTEHTEAIIQQMRELGWL